MHVANGRGKKIMPSFTEISDIPKTYILLILLPYFSLQYFKDDIFDAEEDLTSIKSYLFPRFTTKSTSYFLARSASFFSKKERFL